MKITFEDVEKNLELKDIIDFQNRFNLNLPTNYINLILKYNGGFVENSEYMNVLLSIRFGEVKVEDIINIHQVIEKNILEDYFPFAMDWSDNPITICLKEGNDYRKIVQFYFDTDHEPETLANSLEELFGVESIDDL